MKKKYEIRKLKHELKVTSSNLKLLQQFAYHEEYIAKENMQLKLQIAQLKHDLRHTQGVLFNYESMLITP